ncbi:MAG: methionyl-tRNA formyltransferase [Saprospiraceae bacterium]
MTIDRKNLRIVFMGTPEFAVPSLSILLEHGYDIPAVITAPDAYGGRGGKVLIQSAVKLFALSKGIPVLQPEKLRNPDFLKTLKEINGDVFVVVAFRMLPEVVWNMPKYGTFNLHGSLLPKYRGAAPIHHAIMNGEVKTGVTTFKLKHEIDTGDFVFQESLPIGPEDNVGTIHDKMMELGAKVMLKTISALKDGNLHFVPQRDEDASHAPKLSLENTKIDFNKNAKQIHDFIRGLSPFPTAWMYLDEKITKIYEANFIIKEDHFNPGHIIYNGVNSMQIKCKDGYINILKLKMDGKKQMDIRTFLMGYRPQK